MNNEKRKEETEYAASSVWDELSRRQYLVMESADLREGQCKDIAAGGIPMELALWGPQTALSLVGDDGFEAPELYLKK